MLFNKKYTKNDSFLKAIGLKWLRSFKERTLMFYYFYYKLNNEKKSIEIINYFDKGLNLYRFSSWIFILSQSFWEIVTNFPFNL